MVTVKNIQINNNNPTFRGVDNFGSDKHHHWNSGYVKQIVHEKKIDEFFWTDVEAPHKRTSWLALGGAFSGVMIPLLAIAKKQKPQIKLNTLKGLKEAINIKYELPEILMTGLGGAMGGLLGGLLDRKEKRKLDKIEEGAFQVMNISFPAILVNEATKLCKKHKALNNNFMKLLSSIAGIFLGANLAVILSNKIDSKLFDKYNEDPDRKLKKKDFIVHIDDVIGAFILAKFPLADKLHAEKILPAIYTWSGYHVGES